MRKEPSDYMAHENPLDNTPSSLKLRRIRAQQVQQTANVSHFEVGPTRHYNKDSIDEYDDSSSEESDDDYGGGVMMWDDDEQFVPQPEHVTQKVETKLVAAVLAEEQRNSLIFSTDELHKQYQMLKQWNKKDCDDLRKTTNALISQGAAGGLGKSQQEVSAERTAIDSVGKNLLRLSHGMQRRGGTSKNTQFGVSPASKP